MVVDPSDGIELISPCAESAVLGKIDYGFSNSVLAPQICAQVAKLVLDGVPAEKGQILSRLTKGNRIESMERPLLFGSLESDDEPPVVLLPYAGEEYTKRFHLAIRLQRKFEENDYSCAILSDRLQVADFETGHFLTDPRNMESDISYYVHAAEHSLFLLVTERNAPCDLRLNDEELGADQISVLFRKILTAFQAQ